MSKYILLPLVVIVCLIIGSIQAYANLKSTFDSNAEEWTGMILLIMIGFLLRGKVQKAILEVSLKESKLIRRGGTGYFIAPAS